MSYNLKNKNIVILAMSFAVIMAMNNVAYSQDAASFLLDEPVAEVAQEVNKAGDAVINKTEEVVAEVKEKTNDAVNDLLADDESMSEALFSDAEEKQVQAVAPANEAGLFPLDDAAIGQTDGDFGIDAQSSEEPAAMEAPRSPFENFGNAILSKVDNDLFNQMSKIEKQTTILNLELKREDVRNKVEALRNARLIARQEAENRRIAEEEKLKDMEAARQAKILEAEEKLRAREIELEKVRQNKMLNDYMNEMLVLNQKWIEKNAVLQTRINELEEERKGLITLFEEKIAGVKAKAEEVNTRASEAVEKYTETLNVLNSQISQLKKDILESEEQIRQLKENIEAAKNPFAQGNIDPNSASVDLSQEYAIMDITGQGDDVVAKIVSRDGTTFTVHKGSVLRGGETVIKITEKYIAFDKSGVKAYLYPGGTIMEYEPTNIFSDAEKTPETTEKLSIRPNDATKGAPVFGKPMETRQNSHNNAVQKQKAIPKVNSLSSSRGMFAF